MYRFDGVEDLGILGDFIVITSPPRLRLELCTFDTYVYCIMDPQCTWSWLWSSSCCRSTLYVWWLHLSQFILSWIHTVFIVAMTLFMDSSMDLQCIVGSCAQSLSLSLYNRLPRGIFGTGIDYGYISSSFTSSSSSPTTVLLYKVFRPSYISSNLTL